MKSIVKCAGKLIEAPIQNRATYSCAAVTMDRFDWPGMTDLAAAPTGSSTETNR